MIQRTNKGKCYFNGKEITQEKYDEIAEIIANKPHRDGYDYRLLDDLTWEEFPVVPPEPDEYPSDDEALSIILGGTP